MNRMSLASLVASIGVGTQVKVRSSRLGLWFEGVVVAASDDHVRVVYWINGQARVKLLLRNSWDVLPFMAFAQDQEPVGNEAAALLASLGAGTRHPHQLKLWRAFSREIPKDLHISVSRDLVDLVDAFVFPEALARSLTLETLRAIAFLHQHGIVHRDVKSENVWLVNGRTKLVGSHHAMRVSSRGFLIGRLGTPGFIAPEVILGHEYDYKVDCFGVGVIVFFMLAGSLPFSGSPSERLRNTIRNRVDLDIGHLHERNDEAKAVISRLLEPCPGKRAAAVDIMRHSWFCSCPSVCEEPASVERDTSELDICRKVNVKASIGDDATQSTLAPMSSTSLPELHGIDTLSQLDEISENGDAESPRVRGIDTMSQLDEVSDCEDLELPGEEHVEG